MPIETEKLIIYQLMREIIEERRALSKHYYELKTRLDQLDKKVLNEPKISETSLTILEKEKINQQDYFHKKNRTYHYNSFDRVSRTIVSILKESPVPLNNKQILKKLTNEYELSLTLKNLTCNILPKMNSERSLPVQRAYRGYWQYKLFSKEGSRNL